MSSSKVFVGNLPWSIRTAELSACLSDMDLPFRSAKVIEDRETGQSRGFAFVECNGEAEARMIIEALDGYVIDGRSLNANEARPKGEHSGRRSDRGPASSGGDRGHSDDRGRPVRRERRADSPSFGEDRGRRRRGHWE